MSELGKMKPRRLHRDANCSSEAAGMGLLLAEPGAHKNPRRNESRLGTQCLRGSTPVTKAITASIPLCVLCCLALRCRSRQLWSSSHAPRLAGHSLVATLRFIACL